MFKYFWPSRVYENNNRNHKHKRIQFNKMSEILRYIKYLTGNTPVSYPASVAEDLLQTGPYTVFGGQVQVSFSDRRRMDTVSPSCQSVDVDN